MSAAESAELLFAKIRDAKALKSKAHLPKAREDAARLLEALARRGVEQTGTWLRLPPLVQLRALVASGPQREKALAKALKATTPAERKAAVEALLREGAARRVVRRGEVWLVAPSPAILDDDEARALAALGASLGKLLRAMKVGKKGALSVEREELGAFVDELARLRGPASPDDVMWRLIEASPATALVSVPELVRASSLAPERAKSALLALDRDGRVELRAESGIGTLTEADVALCPMGADGFPLSYLRRKEVA